MLCDFVNFRKFGLFISIFNKCAFLYFSFVSVESAFVLPAKVLVRILTPVAYVPCLDRFRASWMRALRLSVKSHGFYKKSDRLLVFEFTILVYTPAVIINL
jgi:hypothetical protein